MLVDGLLRDRVEVGAWIFEMVVLLVLGEH